MIGKPPRNLKSYLTKVVTFVVTLASAAWAVFSWTANLIGHLAVGDSWDSVVRKMPEWVHLVATTSPWLPGATCVGLGVVLAYVNWPRGEEANERHPAAALGATVTPVPTTRPATVSDMLVVDGARGDPPSFRGRFADNGSDAIFYLEYSAFHPSVGVGRGWTQPRKFDVFRQARYSRGLSISFPIVSHRQNQDGGLWKLGVSDDDTDLINPSGSYKGRITILDAEQREQHVYFVLLPRGREIPKVLGQHMFDHILEWEDAPTRTGDAESLFV